MAALFDKPVSSHRGLSAAVLSSMPRSEYFAALCILGIANGLEPRLVDSVTNYGWINAILLTFDISAIVWIAAVAGIALLLEDRRDLIQKFDLLVGAAFLLLIALPISQVSWLALVMLGLYMMFIAEAGSSRWRGAMIVIAITVPMLWSRLLFRCFADIVLAADAYLVGWMLGTPQVGNVVRFVDGRGDLVILPACSSLAGVSLVFLCWVVIGQTVRRSWSCTDFLWCGLAAASVIVVNVARISLMGLSEAHYETIHGTWGEFSTNLMTLCLSLGICLLGIRRELFSRV